jgi:hypothetical protein
MFMNKSTSTPASAPSNLPAVTYNLTSIDATNSGLPASNSVVYTADSTTAGKFNSSDGQHVLLTYQDKTSSLWYAVSCAPATISTLSTHNYVWGASGVICLDTDTTVDTSKINFAQFSGLTAGTNVEDTTTLVRTNNASYSTTKTNMVVTTTAPPSTTTTNIGTAAISWKALA